MLFDALREFHDGAFVITAPGFEDRQESARRELGEGNFQFIFGINRESTSKEELTAQGLYDEARAIELDRSSKPMSLGHVCCSIGHANVYRHMIEYGIERALIFEDDVVIRPVDSNEIEAIVADIPDDAELIYWGWAGGGYRPVHGPLKQTLYHVQHAIGVLKYDHTMIRNLYAEPYNEHFDVAGKRLLAHAYTLTLSAAEKILSLNTPIALNGDNALLYAVLRGDVRAYNSKVKLFDQRSMDVSDPLLTATAH
jgi:GR25 family glycosyltransferase involved in LPS biosynthesis